MTEETSTNMTDLEDSDAIDELGLSTCMELYDDPVELEQMHLEAQEEMERHIASEPQKDGANLPMEEYDGFFIPVDGALARTPKEQMED